MNPSSWQTHLPGPPATPSRRAKPVLRPRSGAALGSWAAIAHAVSTTLSAIRRLMIRLGRLLNHRRCRGEDLLAIAGQRRINPLAVDNPFGLLRRLALCDDVPVPSFGVDGPPAAQVQHGHVPRDVQR